MLYTNKYVCSIDYLKSDRSKVAKNANKNYIDKNIYYYDEDDFYYVGKLINVDEYDSKITFNYSSNGELFIPKDVILSISLGANDHGYKFIFYHKSGTTAYPVSSMDLDMLEDVSNVLVEKDHINKWFFDNKGKAVGRMLFADIYRGIGFVVMKLHDERFETHKPTFHITSKKTIVTFSK